MTKLLFASDLHCCVDLAGEMALASRLLPADTYDHERDGQLVWHNVMLVDKIERMFEGLERVIRLEAPDLVIFVGDVVNTNWAPNVGAVSSNLRSLSCPTRLVTGNHDIYLTGTGTRLQEETRPGEYASGFRHEWIDSLGLLYLDLFVRHSNGDICKTTDPHDPEATAEYRAQDVDEALAAMDGMPDRRFLAIGHFPIVPPNNRLRVAGRKIGWHWPSGSRLRIRLQRASNLLGFVCGHQHFAHFQRFSSGFHWTLPTLVEYPCALGVMELDAEQITGRLIVSDQEMAKLSLSVRHVEWPAGDLSDRRFVWGTGQ